jgi:MSHA biogenesis protein MshQ
VAASALIRSGRVRLSNAYGSERLTTGLPVPVSIEYFDTAPAAGWRTGVDTCTTITANQFAYDYSGSTLAACKTAGTISGSNPNLTLTLAQPNGGTTGWVDLTLNLGASAAGNTCTPPTNTGTGYSGAASTASAPWLQYNWKGSVANPSARATFGVFRSPLIYRRENY